MWKITACIYVNRFKEQFADYFDRVESNPLTESQRDACVIDEDNNLVLAGAGTGKTSTMVGRAGFLVKSGQAQARADSHAGVCE